MKKIIIVTFLLLVLSACSLDNGLPVLKEVVRDNIQFTGVAVSKEGRLFLSYPLWIDEINNSVVEVLKDQKKAFYPNIRLNTPVGSPMDRFVCVQSIYVDNNNYLWILDPASPHIEGVVEEGAKLFKVDLKENMVIGKYIFTEPIISKISYLNDIRVDVENNIAYISDSGNGGIVVLDLTSGEQRKVLADHYSTKAEPDCVPKINGVDFRDINDKVPQIHVDGIALDIKNKYLYYHALTGKKLYRISTKVLNDKSLTEEELEKSVEQVAETGAADGLIADTNGNIFITAIEENAIKYITPQGELKTLVQDEKIVWPDSLAIADEYLYFTASQINLMPWFNKNIDSRKSPYKIFKISIKNLQ